MGTKGMQILHHFYIIIIYLRALRWTNWCLKTFFLLLVKWIHKTDNLTLLMLSLHPNWIARKSRNIHIFLKLHRCYSVYRKCRRSVSSLKYLNERINFVKITTVTLKCERATYQLLTLNSFTWQVIFVEFRKPVPRTVTFLHGRLRLSHKPSPCNLAM